jgi:adenine-specific DNA-methyltransferase
MMQDLFNNMQFKELLTTLWMKAGAVGECPSIEGGKIEDYYIFLG